MRFPWSGDALDVIEAAETFALDPWAAAAVPSPGRAGPPAVMTRSSGAPLTPPAAVVTRATAMTVPAVRRARNVICGILGTFHLAMWRDGITVEPGSHDVTAGFLRRPQPDRTLAWLLTWTVDDLLFHDIAYWQIIGDRSDSDPLVPRAVQRVDPGKVSTSAADPSAYVIGGKRVPASDVIAFAGSGTGGLCSGPAALTILAAIELEAAALRYARTPVPQVIIKNLGQELDDDEQDALIATYEAARRTSSTAYLNAAVELEAQGWDPSEMQLVEARQHVASEIARLCNLDARWVNAPGDAPQTYANMQDLRRDLVDVTLRPYQETIDQTLSVDATRWAGLNPETHPAPGYQLCTAGKSITLDDRGFLRLSDLDRADLWAKHIASGVLSVDESRSLEPLAPKGSE